MYRKADQWPYHVRPEKLGRGYVFTVTAVTNHQRAFGWMTYVLLLAVVWRLRSLEGNKSLGKGMISKPFRQEITLTQAVAARLAA